MAAHAYYRAEALRHRTPAANAKLTQAEAQDLVDHLCCTASVTQFVTGRLGAIEPTWISPLPVLVSARARTWSWYEYYCDEVDGPAIQMASSMLMVRYVCHEWAHHASQLLFQHYRRTLTERKGVMADIEPYRAHDRHHAELTDWAIAEANRYLAAKAAPEPLPVPAPALDPVAAFFETMPAILTCPCCRASLPKANFGVRVMQRDGAGVPLKFARQSYCNSCRSIRKAG